MISSLPSMFNLQCFTNLEAHARRTFKQNPILHRLLSNKNKNHAFDLSLQPFLHWSQVHYAVAAVRAQLVNANTGLVGCELLHVLRDSCAEVLVSEALCDAPALMCAKQCWCLSGLLMVTGKG